MTIKVCKDKQELAQQVAAQVINLIIQKKAAGENCVLCLPTGSTPIPVYKEIIRRHKEENFDLNHVYTFNLDEYCGLSHDHPESYHYFMAQNLFNHIPIPKNNINIPEGFDDDTKAAEFARQYEQKMQDLGGLDLTLLGIGRTGHLGFNEPGSLENSRTRRVQLHEITRVDAKPSFEPEEVPTHAVTMGLGTILESRQIIMMATGTSKKEIMERFKTEEPNSNNPSTFLKGHFNYIVYMDEAAC
ncbi:hypothetical protein GEMRC1_004335 [Eukaryota sp. GEM-RC1]